MYVWTGGKTKAQPWSKVLLSLISDGNLWYSSNTNSFIRHTQLYNSKAIQDETNITLLKDNMNLKAFTKREARQQYCCSWLYMRTGTKCIWTFLTINSGHDSTSFKINGLGHNKCVSTLIRELWNAYIAIPFFKGGTVQWSPFNIRIVANPTPLSSELCAPKYCTLYCYISIVTLPLCTARNLYPLSGKLIIL